jgi:predicted ATPase
VEKPSREFEFLGRALGAYRIDSRLGAGGMGEVYRAHDTKLDRPVAIKVLTSAYSADPEGVQRFHQEARAASALNHPHILVIHDVGDAEGRAFIVTELVEGRTLRERIGDRSIGMREAIDIGTQVASALAAAHARGIVHRDIKPENIMVRADGYAKVLDFGLAKLVTADEEAEQPTLHTQSGVIVGTPGYMSPEQAAGRPIDFRSDQFSFGTVMYELVTGLRPFERASAVQSAAAVITDHPEPLTRLCPDLPPPLRWAIERCLAKSPDERYSSTADLHRDFTTIHDRISDARGPVTVLPPSNLPTPPTTFVARDDDAEAVIALLTRPDVRWVTLTGPGGVGKTRLALHVSRSLFAAFGDGVYFVSLASISDPRLVLSAIAQTLDVRPAAGESDLDALGRHLRAVGAPILLVLDNFERVTAAAVDVTALVEECPSLKLLVSSRTRLNVSAEHEYPVAPLPLPPATDVRKADAVAAVPAVRLFVERGRAARAGFALTDENAPAIAEICRLLDGLPLAIELAAARVKMLSPEALVARLATRRLSLDGGARDLPMRQQTLRATIDWGYELLTPAEQRLLRRLGVFVGGWTLEAAEAVCDARQDLELDVFDGLSSLVDKSLVRPIVDAAAEPRFMMLATIREYALERLEQAGETDAVRKAHAAFCLVLAEEPAADATAQLKWFSLCEAEHANVRRAIDYLIESQNVEWAARLTTALLPFWQARGRLREGRDALTRAIALGADAPPTVTRARALFALSTIVHPMGEPELTEELGLRALAIYRRLGDGYGQAVALNGIGIAYHRMQRYAEARRSFEEAVALWRDLRHEQAMVRTLSNLAAVAFDADDIPQAIALYRETKAECERLRDVAGTAWAINGEARIEHGRGQHAAAIALYEEALRRFEQIQDGWGAGDCLLAIGIIAAESGDPARARAFFARAHGVIEQVGDVRGTVRTLEAFTQLAALTGQAERAVLLAGAAAAVRHTLSLPLPGPQRERLDGLLEEQRRHLDVQQAAAAWMEGWSMSSEAAIQLAFRS